MPRTNHKQHNIEFQLGFVIHFEDRYYETYEFSKIHIFSRKYVCFWVAEAEIHIFGTKSELSAGHA